MKKNLYITLDYELFLNDITGDVDNCLIIPTEEFLKLMCKYNAKATFFVDASYLVRLNELKESFNSLHDDYQKVTRQLEKIIKEGHRIALHIHPQWFYSHFDGNKWEMDFDHYKLSDMPVEIADKRFEECLYLLKELTGASVSAFRAGGYSIQGYKSFPDILIKNGITKDSSVLYGMKNLSHLHYYDYTSLQSLKIYTFDNNIIQPKPGLEGKVTEFPITTGRLSFFRYCYFKLKNRNQKNNCNWGNGGDLPTKRTRGFLTSVINKMGSSVYAKASIDYQSFTFTDYVLNKAAKTSSDVVIIGHPKNFSPASLSYLEKLLNKSNYTFKLI